MKEYRKANVDSYRQKMLDREVPARFVAFAFQWEANHSVDAVEPASSNTPPGCCI